MNVVLFLIHCALHMHVSDKGGPNFKFNISLTMINRKIKKTHNYSIAHEVRI